MSHSCRSCRIRVAPQQTFVGFQDVLKTSSRYVLKTSSTRLQRNNFTSSKTSWRRLQDQEMFAGMIIPSKHSSWWRCLEELFCLRLQDVLIKTNIFALVIRLQKKSSSRPIHSSCHTSSRRLQDVLKTSSRFIYLFNNLFKVDKFTIIQYTYIHKHSQTNWLIKVN